MSNNVLPQLERATGHRQGRGNQDRSGDSQIRGMVAASTGATGTLHAGDVALADNCNYEVWKSYWRRLKLWEMSKDLM